MPAFEDWHFDWLDVPALLRGAESVLVYPMVDQDPLPQWTFGRVTLLGDAAHPMVPRGSNGAGQAILDAHALRVALESTTDQQQALLAYEADRLPKTIGRRPHQPDQPARCHPARGVGTDRRPSVRRHQRRDDAGGADADLAELPDHRRFRGPGRDVVGRVMSAPRRSRRPAERPPGRPSQAPW